MTDKPVIKKVCTVLEELLYIARHVNTLIHIVLDKGCDRYLFAVLVSRADGGVFDLDQVSDVFRLCYVLSHMISYVVY